MQSVIKGILCTYCICRLLSHVLFATNEFIIISHAPGRSAADYVLQIANCVSVRVCACVCVSVGVYSLIISCVQNISKKL